MDSVGVVLFIGGGGGGGELIEHDI